MDFKSEMCVCLFFVTSVWIGVGMFAQKLCALSHRGATHSTLSEQMRLCGFELPVRKKNMEEFVYS